DFVTLTDGLYAGLDGEVVEVVYLVYPWAGRALLRLPCLCPNKDYWHPYWSEAMDEQQWLTTCDTASMERFLDTRDPPWSRRKRTLYACACVRRVCGLLSNSASNRLMRAEHEADRNPSPFDPGPRPLRRPWLTGKGKPSVRAEAAFDAADLLFCRRLAMQQ